mmetsp:Transcript_42064/g.102671  ORF Transcript_42064/g.102671 Transcript_42064/m.102671 type:complete len:274 (+) Transcript_42064:126-947(+)
MAPGKGVATTLTRSLEGERRRQSPLEEGRSPLEQRVGKVGSYGPHRDGDVGRPRKLLEPPLGGLLPPVKESGKGHNTGARLDLLKRLPVSGLEAAVPVPRSQDVVRHEAKGRGDHEAVPDPHGVGEAPERLADHLGVPRDPHDASLPHVKLWLVDRSNLQEVERGGVEEPEGDERRDPAEGLEAGNQLEVPQSRPVVSVVDEEDDARHGEGEAHYAKKDSPDPLPNPLRPKRFVDSNLRLCTESGQAAVAHPKEGEHGHHSDAGVASSEIHKK